MEKAAVIVHGRTRYRDYREKFLVRPVDMEGEEIYQWKQLVLQCTKEPEAMRDSHQARRAVISCGSFAAVGVAAYWRDIYPASFEDEGHRPVYGFVGFIWKKENAAQIQDFPGPQAFANLIRQYVLPRWEEPKNSVGAADATFSDYLQKPESAEAEVPGWETDTGLLQALRQAGQGADVFFCTGISEMADTGITAVEGPKNMPAASKQPGQAKHWVGTAKWIAAAAVMAVVGWLALCYGQF